MQFQKAAETETPETVSDVRNMSQKVSAASCVSESCAPAGDSENFSSLWSDLQSLEILALLFVVVDF